MAIRFPTQLNRVEVDAVRQFAINYPRCNVVPIEIFFEPDDTFYIDYDYYQDPNRLEIAALFVAFSEVTPIYCWAGAAGDGKSAGWNPESVAPEMQQVRAEVARMRELGLWGRP